jgi:hypothetical protein
MLAPPGDLLRAGFEMKLNRVKRATRSYIRDRADQATGTATSYAIAAGLYAAAGVFLLAACMVGLFALFRWIELTYGRFPAYGTIGAIMVVLAAVCAGLAAARLKRPPRQYPSLASRLRVAIASPLVREPTQDNAGPGGVDPDAIPLAPSTPRRAVARSRNGVSIPVGFGATALLLGWAAARRYQQRRRYPAPSKEQPKK